MASRRILLVAGARPNFMKIAALHGALRGREGLSTEILHTGQHAGEAMSEAILRDLGLPEPNHRIDLGNPTPVFMAARLWVRIREHLAARPPDLVVVVGDVTSTGAAALAAADLGIPVAHVEAGLRSFDRTMPEEVNRWLADHAADLLFTTEADGERNLRREGIAGEGVVFAGNVMVDTLRRFLPKTDLGTPRALGLPPGAYAVLTVHRAANVDRPDVLRGILAGVARAAKGLPVIFPTHPRTRARMREYGIALPDGVRACAPQGYLAFIDLLRHARAVLTDSGGVQQEAAVLGIPCVTLRDRTEVPVTLAIGANRLAGTEEAKIEHALEQALAAPRGWSLPPLWDGRAADRIADRIDAFLFTRGVAGTAPPARVTASVIAWNDRDHLRRCLASLRAQRGASIRIVVADNASTDESAAMVREEYPEAKLFSPGENLGYAGAHDLVFSVTEDPFFLVLNADVRLEPDYVARLVSAMGEDQGLGAVSGKLLREGAAAGAIVDSAGIVRDGRGRFRDLGAGLPDDGRVPFGEVFGVCGAAALYRRGAVLDSVPDLPGAGRPFDAAFFAYYEDADLAWSLRSRGWRARIVPEALAFHVRGGSGAPSRAVERLLHRNAFWLLVKHARGADLARILPGFLLHETAKLLQILLRKPSLLGVYGERWRGLPAMRARRRALRARAGRPSGTPAPDLQRRERRLRDAQAEQYEAIAGGPYHERVEIVATLDRLGAHAGERVVDLGCGTGRVAARIAATGARVTGVDFSFESLRRARREAPGLLLIQADLTRLPFADGAFDRAISCQVFQHLPDPDLRRRGAAEAARVLRKEGTLVLTAYHDAWFRRPFLPREDFHPGGLFYHRFRPGELERLLGERFDVVASVGVRHFPARSVGERLMGRRGFAWIPRLDRRLERTPLARALAHLWLVKAVRRAGEEP